MLIRIKLAENDISLLTELEYGALENIGLSAFYGHHVITATRESLRFLTSELGLSRRATAAFRQALDRASEFDSLERLVARKIVVDRNRLEPTLVGDTWEVPLAVLSDEALLNAPVLLAENLHDANLYCHLGRWYRWHAGFRTLAFFCVPTGGGGNTVSKELEARLTPHPRLTLCIVDSDRAHPGASLGETSRRCLEVLPEDKWFAILKIPEALELENLLPEAWLRETQTGHQTPQSLSAIRTFEDLGAYFLKRYTDLKAGFTSCELMSSAVAAVRTCAIADFGLISAQRPLLATCVQNTECSHGAVPCFRFAGLGGTLPEQVNGWLESARPDQTSAVQKDTVLALLGKLIFEWGVAAPKIRA